MSELKHPIDGWRWSGMAGHLCVAAYCRFHLTTRVGDLLVSTVGRYIPRHKALTDEDEQESCKAHPEGYEIGAGRLYETLVFRIKMPIARCRCGCGAPDVDYNELTIVPYATAKHANKGHMEMCLRVARGEFDKEEE